MSTINTNRATYNKVNPNIHCGKKDTPRVNQTTTSKTETFYTVRVGDKTRHCTNLDQVNAILARHSTAQVVRSDRTTVVTTTHKRIR